MREPTLVDYLTVIFRHWKALLAIMSLSVIASVVIALQMNRIYRSEIVVTPVPDDAGSDFLSRVTPQLSGLADIVGLGSQSTISRNELVAFLESKEFARDFIDAYNLVPILFDDIWDAEKLQWDVDDDKEIPTEADAIRKFQEEVLSIVEARRTTGLITVSVESEDREITALWATRYVQFANDKVRRRVISEAQKSREYLENELEKTSIVELRQSIYRLIESQINRIMVANVRQEYAFRVIDSAFVPDEDQFVSPNRPLIVMVGFVFGVLVGISAILLRSFLTAIGASESRVLS